MDNQPQQPILSQEQPENPVLSQPQSVPALKQKRSKALPMVIALAVVLIAGVVYATYAWQHNKVNSSNAKVASLQSQLSSLQSQVTKLSKQIAATPTTLTSTPTPLSTTATTQLLNTFYTQYIAASSSTSTTQATLIKQVIQQYGTSNLLSYAYPSSGSYYENPIVCAQDKPTSFSVSGVTSTSTSASGIITEVFGSSNVKVNATVVNQSGSLKIDTIACNPVLTPQQGSN